MGLADVTPIQQQLAERQGKPRARYSYLIPKSCHRLTEIREVTLVELTGEEEIFATKRGRNEVMLIAAELAKESLRAIDGKHVSTGDGTTDSAWREMHPKVRNFITTAYGRLHMPEQEDVQDFLESVRVDVA